MLITSKEEHILLLVSFLTLLLGVFSNVSANGLSGWIHRYIGCISLTRVNYEMISQMAYLMGCIVTLVALVGLLSVICV